MKNTSSEKVIALVPMKGHSERVPNKNIKPLAGKPLCHWILEQLTQSKYIQHIYVDTDSSVIAREVQDNFKNVTIIPRPKEIQGDFVAMNKIIEHDLFCIKGEYFLQTHSTNPLLQTTTIDQAITAFFQPGKHDTLFSVTKLQTRLYTKEGKPLNHNPKELLRTQDLEPIYEENSNLYLFSREDFMKHKRRIGEHPKLFEMNALEAIDIDTPEMFTLAEYILKSKSSTQV